MLKTAVKAGERIFIGDTATLVVEKTTRAGCSISFTTPDVHFCRSLEEQQELKFLGLVISCVRAGKNSVTLGFEGPRDIQVIRENAKCKLPK